MSHALILKKLYEAQDLTFAEAQLLVGEIVSGALEPAQIAGILIALKIKGETPAEIGGAARALQEAAVRVPTARERRSSNIRAWRSGNRCVCYAGPTMLPRCWSMRKISMHAGKISSATV